MLTSQVRHARRGRNGGSSSSGLCRWRGYEFVMDIERFDPDDAVLGKQVSRGLRRR